jgi:hypothetical protein
LAVRAERCLVCGFLRSELTEREDEGEVVFGPLRFPFDLEADQARLVGVVVDGSDGLGGLPPGEAPR